MRGRRRSWPRSTRPFNLDPADVEARITPRTAGILVVHMLGAPARIDELKAVADRHGDPAHRGLRPGLRRDLQGPRASAASARPASYSFNEYKTITCGDGGMIVTDDDGLYERAFAMHDQGHAPESARVEVRGPAVPRHELPDDRAVGRGPAARRSASSTDPSHLRANKAIVKSMLGGGARSSGSASWPTPRATSRPISW